MTSWVGFTFKVFAMLAVIAFSTGNEEKKSKDPIEAALSSLDSKEKTDFLSYFLALGLKDWAESQPRPPKFLIYKPNAFIKSLNISQNSLEKFEQMNIPKESRKKLLQWTKTEFNLSTMNVIELIRTKKCWGTICLPDIGELCCPW